MIKTQGNLDDHSSAELKGVPTVLRGPHRPDLLRDETLSDILIATAKRRPQHPALIWGERVVSYGELNSASEKIAAALTRRGAAAEKIIGLFLPRGADLLIAQAGITKSGAAWLPFDAETPSERIKTCLQSANAIGLVTCREWLPRLAEFPVPVFAVEGLLAESLEFEVSSLKFPKTETSNFKPKTSNLSPAYVIYTSGSTGQPKGIAISHRSICHFLRSENELLGVREDDRVFQGFSVAFDMSFEEIWISYLVGATLWIAPPSLMGDPESLAQTLTRERITVLHAVPTLMALVNDPLPTLRLINLGGEACPDALAQRLIKPGRKLFNTYGPTETAVSASLAELKSGEPVTIGTPLPNYGLLVVDEQRRPVSIGEVGELCIFGPGLAIGYLGRDDLTTKQFVSNPCAANDAESKMYLTGDLARIDSDGKVFCLGRADSQVKIRGFRVELDEIAAALSAQPGVAAAAVVVRPIADVDQVVAFIVPGKFENRGDDSLSPRGMSGERAGERGFENKQTSSPPPSPPIHGGEGENSKSRLEPIHLRQALAARLPHYMVPAHFEIVSELPRLTSGKVDSKALKIIPFKTVMPTEESAAARNEHEAVLFAALGKLFPSRALQPEADFFDDLGGHSLLVARLVSILRSDARYAMLGVQEVYRERKLGGIASAMERQGNQQQQQPSAPARSETPLCRRFFCGLAQAAAIPFFVLLHMADWLAPFFTYHYFTGEEDDSIPLAVLYALGVFVLAQFINFVIAVLGKRLVGRLKPGQYPLWGFTYFRWWLAEKFLELPDDYMLAGTPWMPLYLRAIGARVGRDVMIDTLTLGAPELLTVENGVSIGTFVNIENVRVEGGRMIVGPVLLKSESVIESYSVLENDTKVGEGSKLLGQSALAAGREIPDGEIWDGAPARVCNEVSETLPPRPQVSFARRWAGAFLFALTAIVISVLFFLPTFPAFMLIDWLDAHTLDIFESEIEPLPAFGLFFLLAIPASALLVGVTMFATSVLRRLLPRQRPGIASIHSFTFWRRKVVAMILDSSLHVLHGLYASVYAPMWLRSLGVKVGRHAEVSTAAGMVPELLSLGDDSFIADGVMLGDEELRGGWMVLKGTKIGNRSFVGNGTYVPDGAAVPDDILIGVQTRTPKNAELKSGQTWMGSPPLLLPARETLQGFPESLTFRPSALRRLARGFIEALRIVLPLAMVIAAGYLMVVLIMPMVEDGFEMDAVIALALAGGIYGVASFLLVVALKWILIRRYCPRAAPMWTPFVWISEAVTNLYESLAVPNFLDILRGTPMLPWALRLLGVRIGKGVYLNTTDMTEFDCVRIGDFAELNGWCGPQTHLFEDRVMKIGTVEIGARVTVGARSTILYDTQVGDDVCLGPLTLVAKGERLPPKTRWEGSPASPTE